MSSSERQHVYNLNPSPANSTITLPSAPVNGNLLICIVTHFTNGPSWLNGWAPLFDQNAAQMDIAVIYKYAGPGESATQTPIGGSFTNGFMCWEIQGVSGVIGTDIPATHHGVDLALVAMGYSTTSFNTGANNRGILGGVGVSSNSGGASWTGATFSGGAAPVGSQLTNAGFGGNRELRFEAFVDLFATSGTAVQYSLSSITPNQGGVGLYALIEVNDFSIGAGPVVGVNLVGVEATGEVGALAPVGGTVTAFLHGVAIIGVAGDFNVLAGTPLPPPPPGGWTLDIADEQDNPILRGVPLITGADLLAQYTSLEFGGELIVQTDHDVDAIPTFANIGSTSHVYFIAITDTGREVFEIPLTPVPQRFFIELAGATYRLTLYWVATG